MRCSSEWQCTKCAEKEIDSNDGKVKAGLIFDDIKAVSIAARVDLRYQVVWKSAELRQKYERNECKEVWQASHCELKKNIDLDWKNKYVKVLEYCKDARGETWLSLDWDVKQNEFWKFAESFILEPNLEFNWQSKPQNDKNNEKSEENRVDNVISSNEIGINRNENDNSRNEETEKKELERMKRRQFKQVTVKTPQTKRKLLAKTKRKSLRSRAPTQFKAPRIDFEKRSNYLNRIKTDESNEGEKAFEVLYFVERANNNDCEIWYELEFCEYNASPRIGSIVYKDDQFLRITNIVKTEDEEIIYNLKECNAPKHFNLSKNRNVSNKIKINGNDKKSETNEMEPTNRDKTGTALNDSDISSGEENSVNEMEIEWEIENNLAGNSLGNTLQKLNKTLDAFLQKIKNQRDANVSKEKNKIDFESGSQGLSDGSESDTNSLANTAVEPINELLENRSDPTFKRENSVNESNDNCSDDANDGSEVEWETDTETGDSNGIENNIVPKLSSRSKNNSLLFESDANLVANTKSMNRNENRANDANLVNINSMSGNENNIETEERKEMSDGNTFEKLNKKLDDLLEKVKNKRSKIKNTPLFENRAKIKNTPLLENDANLANINSMSRNENTNERKEMSDALLQKIKNKIDFESGSQISDGNDTETGDSNEIETKSNENNHNSLSSRNENTNDFVEGIETLSQFESGNENRNGKERKEMSDGKKRDSKVSKENKNKIDIESGSQRSSDGSESDTNQNEALLNLRAQRDALRATIRDLSVNDNGNERNKSGKNENISNGRMDNIEDDEFERMYEQLDIPEDKKKLMTKERVIRKMKECPQAANHLEALEFACMVDEFCSKG